ncbi:MAG: NAD(+)/NADH kinase [Lachnospiraceae bacterium]
MDRFFIIANGNKESIQSAIDEMTSYLTAKGKRCGCVNGYVNKDDVPEDVECVMVLGGDGTLLRASRELMERDCAFIGVNFGHLGFLADVEKDGIIEMLDRLISGRFNIERRMMLKGKVIRDGSVIAEEAALNDIVINRSGLLGIMDFTVYVNDMRLRDYRADGMIVATPTGSTAYSMSAGGPIVKPSANLVVLTPICPHTLNTRSIVLEGEDIIEIDIKQGKKDIDSVRAVYFDGDRYVEVLNGDRIVIRRSDISTKIIKLSSVSFLEILGRKMSSNEDSKA